MEVLYKNDVIAQIENIYRENSWLSGYFIPGTMYMKYKVFLDALMSEDDFDDTQFDDDLLNENNWFVRDEVGMKGIWFPAVHYDNGIIYIRYR